jgi:crotonobetainyl-CoA:carnitine CoA-transferase CaiB-like acyl-CoA transferase
LQPVISKSGPAGRSIRLEQFASNISSSTGVIDEAQFLSRPSVALRLGDLGARVVKVERRVLPGPCRKPYRSPSIT